jgi:3-methyladenine DNA glycosylase AlkD
MLELLTDLQERLQSGAQDAKRRWWERYLKGQAAFRGVPMADVRRSIKAWHADYGAALKPDQLRAFADLLIRQRHTEDKLAGILLIQEILVPAGIVTTADLPRFATYFDEGHLGDWNVVDWFCVKALNALVTRYGPEAGPMILSWSKAEVLWRARASVVTFANVSSKASSVYPGLPEGILAATEDLIGRPERFAKTGVGWVLAGLGAHRPDEVEQFILRRLSDFSLESLRNACSNLRPEVGERLLKAFRALP